MLPNNYSFSTDTNQLAEQLDIFYKDLIIGINGDIRLWSPTVYGSTSTGQFTFTNRSGWSWRRGLMVNLWMDIGWSGTTATGDLLIELPYKVINSNDEPFIGVVENKSNINFTAGYTYLTWKVLPNTFVSSIVESGDNVASQNIQVQNSGRIIGHICYIGQEYA